ncbi:hypothetical protein [Lysinibacillus xylanilyticus]|uniref:hypothetical protein n=1 Tax=Lysinibacillus xylanilyticus TaxID=582475 RepID=UPI003D043FFA
MVISKPVILGGQFNFRILTNKLSKIEYAKVKAHLWMHMLNDGQKPKKWLKPSGRGTRVNFDKIHSKEDYEKGLSELEIYLNEINEEFGLAYKLNKE